MTLRLPLLAQLGFLAASVLIVGCGGSGLDDEGRVAASGTVTLDSTPLPSGSVSFVDSTGVVAGVGVIKEGSYTVSKSAGVSGIPAGKYQVQIESWKVEPGAVDANGEIGGPGVPAIPEAYMSVKTSKLEADITDGGQNVNDFALKSDGP
ncbi:MAG: hypothetical protein ACK5Q5_21375 [Planctomycetaceae bacterium]